MKFIIIHDGKKEAAKMADQLNALISQLENVSTTVWTEKQYLDNKPTLSSDEYLVFLGKTKSGENIIASPLFKNHYSEFNMRYGWLGKQAVMGLSPKYHFDEDKVKQFTDLYNSTFKKEIENNAKNNKPKGKISGIVSKVDKKIKNVPTAGKIAAVVGGVIAAPVLAPAAAIGAFGLFGMGKIVAVTAGTYLIKGHIDKTRLNKDANDLLLKKFFDEGLTSFLNIKE